MGLDVGVYSNIKEVDVQGIDIEDIEDEIDYDFIAYVLDVEDWAYKIKNLTKDGYYTGTYEGNFVSYSYGSHSMFRVELLKLIKREDLLIKNEINWEILPNDIPFIDLIDFADNEGCLDWEVSNKLYNDFNEWLPKAILYFDFIGLDRYKSWMEAFEVAKNNKGVVVFS